MAASWGSFPVLRHTVECLWQKLPSHTCQPSTHTVLRPTYAEVPHTPITCTCPDAHTSSTRTYSNPSGMVSHSPQTRHPPTHLHPGGMQEQCSLPPQSLPSLPSDTCPLSTQRQSKLNKHLPGVKSKCPVRYVLGAFVSPKFGPIKPAMMRPFFFRSFLHHQTSAPASPMSAGPEGSSQGE